MIRIILSFVLSVGFIFGQAKAQIPKRHIVDVTLVYGNVKYYYPAKHVNESDWNRLTAYIITYYKQDSIALRQPVAFHKYLVQKYAELGLTINLYEHKPTGQTTVLVRGRHWQYKGYPFSKNKYVAGLMVPFYNLFLNPYGKRFKRNTADYFNQLNSLTRLSATQNELVVQLHDSLWLGLPWKGQAKKTASTAFKAFTYPTDRNDDPFKLMCLIDTWNLFYHFLPTSDSKATLLARLLQSSDNMLAGSTPFDEEEKLASATDDAHTNFVAYYYLPGHFYLIDNSYYYRGERIGDVGVETLKVLKYNDKGVDSVYHSFLLKVASHQASGKSYFALRRMTAPDDTVPVKLLVQHIGSADTSTIYVHGRFSMADPGSDRTQGKAHVVNPQLGIYYVDLKNTSSKGFVKILKSDDCKSLIIDVRGHPYLNNNFLKSLATEHCADVKGGIPIYSFPDKNGITIKPDIEKIKPKKKKIEKPMVLLCDASSISYAETILATFQNCTKAVIIGSPTAGTTGNLVLAPSYYTAKKYDLLPFTPMIIYNADGSTFTGILPNILVTSTVSGLQSGKDEIFEAAKEYLERGAKP